MDGRSQPPGISVLRAYVAAQIAANGLRATAREIGLRPFGLQYFLEGGAPRTATLRKLGNWYIRSTASSPRESDTAPSVALGILVRDLPPARQAEAIRRSLIFYRDLYQKLGTALPEWLKDSDS